MNLHKVWARVLMMGATGCTTSAARAPAPEALAVESKMPPDAQPTIVLVHGAFADASSWGKVIGILQPEGYTVVAVQNAMTSFDGDVATTERALDAQTRPVVLVAHSYGGMVIGAAARGSAKVKALVFVAAFGLDEGESPNSAGAKFAAPPLNAAIKQDASGFLSVDPAKFDIFASDVPAAERNVLAATQRPILGSIFDVRVPAPAWKTIPSFFLVAANDEAINPDFERFMAKRMGATTVEVQSSHLAMISHPDAVAAIIHRAADTVSRESVR
jgi:pimeloyl-ACP methyl ester carboxylesterase